MAEIAALRNAVRTELARRPLEHALCLLDQSKEKRNVTRPQGAPTVKPSSVAWFSVFLLASGARAQSLQAPSVWFSYDKPGRQVFKSIQLELPDNSRNGFDDLADEIVVIGERQRRHLQLVKPDEDMTGPRGLDAAQPVVPGIGAVCSYKTLCYDMSQPPLRADLVKVFFPGETP